MPLGWLPDKPLAARGARRQTRRHEAVARQTWNATSNRHMLAVNRALGYVVDGHGREWQKRLD